MKQEHGSEGEFMHKPGDLFVVFGGIHILDQVGRGVDPADLECEEYRAKCGIESQSWSMPSQGVRGADFVKSVKEGEGKLAVKCSSCFGST